MNFIKELTYQKAAVKELILTKLITFNNNPKPNQIQFSSLYYVTALAPMHRDFLFLSIKDFFLSRPDKAPNQLAETFFSRKKPSEVRKTRRMRKDPFPRPI